MGGHFWDDVKQVKTVGSVGVLPADVVAKAQRYIQRHTRDEDDCRTLLEMLGIGDTGGH